MKKTMWISLSLIAALFLTGCSMFSRSKNVEPTEPQPPMPAHIEPHQASDLKVNAKSEMSPGMVEAEETPKDSSTQVTAEPLPKRATPHFKTHTGVAPEKALGWLKNGNIRYVKGRLRKDGQSQKDRLRVMKSQKPHTIVLSCSDSRVPPEIVFDEKLGELYTIRTAGEALDDNVVASIEYAIEHLGTRLVLVMGHTSCSTLRAAVGTLNGGDAGSPALNALMKSLHPHLQAFKTAPMSKDLGLEAMANAEGVIQDLISRSTLIAEAYDGGDVVIRPALYHLDSGVVTIK